MSTPTKPRLGNPNLVPYSPEEDAAIRRLWPRAHVHEIEAALPRRTMKNLRARAMQLGVPCEGRPRRAPAAPAPKPRAAPARPAVEPAPKPKRAEDKRLAGIVVTADELRRLPITHEGRRAWAAAVCISGAAGQLAWQQWAQQQS